MAWLTGLALLAGLPVPCDCAEPTAADPHACCAPPVGVRAADSDCCAAAAPGRDRETETPLTPAFALAPGFAPVTVVAAVAVPLHPRPAAAPDPGAVSPPTVRRL